MSEEGDMMGYRMFSNSNYLYVQTDLGKGVLLIPNVFLTHLMRGFSAN